jgi:hypothetical protein
MRTLQPAFILAFSFFAAGAFAQTSGDTSTRGNTPPGMSQDGSRPADGAIKGGSIRPGEAAGVPNTGGTAPNSEERLKRCEQLTGKLREDCIENERSAAGGSSAPKTDIDKLGGEQPSTK